jgi:hypothetical protein
MVDWTEYSCGWRNDGGLNVVIGVRFSDKALQTSDILHQTL